MAVLEEFLINGGEINKSPEEFIFIRILEYREISFESKNKCFLGLVDVEKENKVVFIKETENSLKDYYVNIFVQDLNIFPINKMIYFGENFSIFPLIKDYKKCRDRIKLASYLATIQKRYNKSVDSKIKEKFESHLGYKNRYRKLGFSFFEQNMDVINARDIDGNTLLKLFEASYQRNYDLTICHCDYRPANTFLIPDSSEIGILDLEEFCADSPTFDLARLLGSAWVKDWDDIMRTYTMEVSRNFGDVKKETFMDYLLYASTLIISVTINNEPEPEKYINPVLRNISYVLESLT